MGQRGMRVLVVFACLAVALAVGVAAADETCNSPYVAKLIKGQEDYVYVWALGVEGMGDGFDKLVTIDVNPKSKTYGKVLGSVSVGTRGEAHHMGFTDDRRFLWAGGLAEQQIHVFDIATDPAKPKLVKTIKDMGEKSGYLGPHTYYAMPGRMLVQALSNTKDKGGVTGMAVYNNKGDYITSYPMPTDNGGDGYGYDLAVNPKKNVLLTSSFTGYANYMRPLGDLIKDAEAMKKFGNTMVVWDLKAMKPKKVFSVPGRAAGDPLVAQHRRQLGDHRRGAHLQALARQAGRRASGRPRRSATIGDPAKIPLPVDISITRDGKGLWVNTFMDGNTRYFDLSNPEAPKQTYEKVTGKQVNMISQSWDGKRVYITSSLLANWDKGGADNEQFLRGFTWDGKELKQAFEVDFTQEKLGRAHHMKLGSEVAEAPCVSRLASAAALLAGLRRRVRRAGAAHDAEPPCPRSTSSRRRRAPTRCTASWRRPTARCSTSTAAPQRLRALHARAHHAARLHLHALHRSRGLPARLPGLRSPQASDRRPAGAARAGPAGDAVVRSRARHPGGHARVRRQPRAGRRGRGVRWHFLTTRSTRELLPLLGGLRAGPALGRRSLERPARRELSHVLKVFLIDRRGFVREIYTSTFLHPRTVLNDIETLRLER